MAHLHACTHFYGQGTTTFGHLVVEGRVNDLHTLRREMAGMTINAEEMCNLIPRVLCSISLVLAVHDLNSRPAKSKSTAEEQVAA